MALSFKGRRRPRGGSRSTQNLLVAWVALLLASPALAQVCNPVNGQPNIGITDLMGSVPGPLSCNGVFACNQPTTSAARYEVVPSTCDPAVQTCTVRASVPFEAPGNSRNTDPNGRTLILEWADPGGSPAGSCGAGSSLTVEDAEAWIEVGFSCQNPLGRGIYELKVRTCPCLIPPFCPCTERSTTASVSLEETALAAAVCPPPPVPWSCNESNSCQAGCMGPNGSGAGGSGSGGSSAAGGGPALGGNGYGPGAFIRYQAGGVGRQNQPQPADWNTLLGRYWSHDYAERIVPDPDDSHVWLLTRHATFREFTDANLDGTYETAVPSDEYRQLTKTGTGWELRELDGMIHAYDLGGRWTSSTDRNGNAKTGVYDPMTSRLERVNFPDGRHELLTYDGGGRLDTITEVGVDGASTRLWNYDWSGLDLVRIDRPDGRSWSLLYGDIRHPGFLTRLTLLGDDGTSERIEGVWDYDSRGNVVATWRGAVGKDDPGAVDTWLFSFDDPVLPVTTTVTDPLGTESMHTFGRDPGNRKPRLESVSGDCPTSCGAGPNSQMIYDSAQPLRVSSMTNGRGVTTAMTYDTFGQIVSRTEAFLDPELERTTTWEYDPVYPSLVTRIERPSTTGEPMDSRVTRMIRDATGNVTNRFQEGVENGSAFSFETVMTYTAEGMIETLDGPDHGTDDLVTFVYDTVDRGGLILEERIDPIIGSRLYGNDAFNRRISETDSNGVSAETTYDAFNRALTVTDKGAVSADDLVTESRYTTFGDLFLTVMPRGNVLERTYDSAGRMISLERRPDDQTASHGERVRFELNAYGQKTLEAQERWEAGAWVERSRISLMYSTRCHLDATETGSGGTVSRTEYLYDCNNNLTQVWDANQDRGAGDPASTVYDFDLLDRVSRVSQPFGGPVGGVAETQYTYDVQDHLTRLIDAEGTVASYAYSDRDLMTSETSENSGITTSTYTDNGQLETRTDARGIVETRTYDALDRIQSADYPGLDQDIAYTYDDPAFPFSIGRLTKIERAGTAIDFVYDRFGRVTSDGALSFEYDKNSNRFEIRYSEGVVARYTFDYADREATLEADLGGGFIPVVSGSGYLPSGPLESLTLGSGLEEIRSFDTRYFPAGIAVAGSSGNLLQWSYQVDGVGNPTGIDDLIDSANDRTYSYQPFQYFLTQGDGPWGTRSWTYDTLGNRLSESRNGAAADLYVYEQNSAAAGNTGRLDLINLGVMGTRNFSYDAAGNQTEVSAGGNVVARAYDEASRLSLQGRAVADASASFLYDGRGFLRQSTSMEPSDPGASLFCDGFETGDTSGWGSGGSTCFEMRVTLPTYSSEGLLHTLTTSDGSTSILYFAGRPVAQAAGQLTFLSTDHLGTPVYASDQSGTEIWEGGFEPFGLDYSGAGSNGIFLRLPGQWEDQILTESSLGGGAFYNVNRWYLAASDRYSRPDPIGVSGSSLLNPYLYADANPISVRDPYGLKVELWCAPIGAGTNNRARRRVGELGFGHCFLRVKCDGCSSEGRPAYDWAVEILGTQDGQGEFPPELNGYGRRPEAEIVPFSPSDFDSSDCSTEDCILREYERLKTVGYRYPFPSGYLNGPNSNTFVQDLLKACGVTFVQWPDDVTGVEK